MGHREATLFAIIAQQLQVEAIKTKKLVRNIYFRLHKALSKLVKEKICVSCVSFYTIILNC